MSARRLWVVVLVLAVGGITVVGRAVQVTVVEGDEWRARAQSQHQQVIEVPGPRGVAVRHVDDVIPIPRDSRHLVVEPMGDRLASKAERGGGVIANRVTDV